MVTPLIEVCRPVGDVQSCQMREALDRAVPFGQIANLAFDGVKRSKRVESENRNRHIIGTKGVREFRRDAESVFSDEKQSLRNGADGVGQRFFMALHDPAWT